MSVEAVFCAKLLLQLLINNMLIISYLEIYNKAIIELLKFV